MKKTEVQVTKVLESLHLLDLSMGLKMPLLLIIISFRDSLRRAQE